MVERITCRPSRERSNFVSLQPCEVLRITKPISFVSIRVNSCSFVVPMGKNHEWTPINTNSFNNSAVGSRTDVLCSRIFFVDDFRRLKCYVQSNSTYGIRTVSETPSQIGRNHNAYRTGSPSRVCSSSRKRTGFVMRGSRAFFCQVIVTSN